MLRTYSAQIWFLALAVAWLLASTQIWRPEGWSVLALYGYWTVRILIEAGLFVAFAELISRLPGLRKKVLLPALLAALISLVPFALSITALDLILGLPELDGTVTLGSTVGGASAAQIATESRVGSFFREILYLSDNHLALCLILTAPRLLASLNRTPAKLDQSATTSDPQTDNGISNLPQDEAPASGTNASAETGYLRHLDQPLKGDLLHIEAQEHYVRLVSGSENRMVLYRFNDIVSELPDDAGMQVHRSHWIAFGAMIRLIKEDGRLWLELTDGERVPVSRKYADEVRAKVDALAPESKRAAT